MAVPQKYRELGDFHEYYSGKRAAPYLTLFIGGNHEASNHLLELYYGGWVAPNIYYLGAANVIRCGPLRIAGLSGIWKGYNYNKPHRERLPFNQDDVRSFYHVRELDVRKLLQIKTQVDVGLSHDWPRGVEWMGDWKALFRRKSHLESDARAGQLGSNAAKFVMERLRPPYWFSGHMHDKFVALVRYDGVPATAESALDSGTNAAVQEHDGAGAAIDNHHTVDTTPSKSGPLRNGDEIDLDMDDDGDQPAQPVDEEKNDPWRNAGAEFPQEEDSIPEDIRAQLPASFNRPQKREPSPPASPPEAIVNKTTRFLALDKCLPNRYFLQLLDVEPISQLSSSGASPEPPYHLSYDKEWLAITRVFASDLHIGNPSAGVPPNRGERYYQPLIAAEEKWVEENVEKKDLMQIPEDFEITAPVYDPNENIGPYEQPLEYTNPHTARFCELLQIPNPFHLSGEERQQRMMNGPMPADPRMASRGRGRDGGRGSRGGGRGRSRGGGRAFR